MARFCSNTESGRQFSKEVKVVDRTSGWMLSTITRSLLPKTPNYTFLTSNRLCCLLLSLAIKRGSMWIVRSKKKHVTPNKSP